MAIEERVELLARSKFERAHYALTWAWVGSHVTLALWAFGSMPFRLSAVAGFGGFGLMFLLVYLSRFMLLEFHSALDLRQKFALFMVSLAFLSLPRFFDPRAPLVFCVAALNLPLTAAACRPFDFHRLYCLNLIWLVLFVREMPGMPPALWIAEGVLIPAVFASDYLAWKAEGKPEARRASFRMLAYATLMYAGAALAALAIALAALPALRPAREEWRPAIQLADWRHPTPVAARLDSRTVMELAQDSALVVVALVILFMLLKYIDKRLGRRQGTETFTAEGRMIYRGKTRHEIAPDEPVFDLSTPRGRIEYAYNLFLRRMGEKGLGRKPSQTPHEYAGTLGEISTIPPRNLAGATRDFEAAKYGEKEFTEDEAEAYRRRMEIMADEAEKAPGA